MEEENKDLKQKEVEENVVELEEKELDDIISKKVDAISDSLLEKFQKNLKDQQEKKVEVKAETKEQFDATRKFIKALRNDDRATIKTMTTANDDDAAAGYTIPTELLKEILRVAEDQYGVARREMWYLPFSGAGNTRTIPKLGSSVSVAWTNEGAAKHRTEPSFELVTQTLKKMTAIITMTEELLEDTQINMTQLIATLVAEAIAKEEDAQFLAGTGAPWTGILNNGSVLSQDASGTSIANLEADDILDAWDKIPTSCKPGAKFYCHPTVVSVLRKLKDDQGQYIFQGPTGSNTPPTVWGIPIVETEVLPSISDTAADTKFCFIGNLKKAAIFGDKQQIRVKLLTEATLSATGDEQSDVYLAEQDMVALRFVERVGYVLAMPETICVIKTQASAS